MLDKIAAAKGSAAYGMVCSYKMEPSSKSTSDCVVQNGLERCSDGLFCTLDRDNSVCGTEWFGTMQRGANQAIFVSADRLFAADSVLVLGCCAAEECRK